MPALGQPLTGCFREIFYSLGDAWKIRAMQSHLSLVIEVLLVWHRKNTIASFRRANIKGASWVEFDVMLSADGTPILFHDDTVNRTTNGRGALAKLNLKEIQSLDAGR